MSYRKVCKRILALFVDKMTAIARVCNVVHTHRALYWVRTINPPHSQIFRGKLKCYFSLYQIETFWLCTSSVCTLQNRGSINPFLFRKKTAIISSEGVSPPLKKTPWSVLRGQCYLTSRVWQPSADSNGRLACFKFEKSVPNGHYYLQSLPDYSAEMFVEGRRALEAVKALWGLISRSILDQGFFLKQCHHKIQKDTCKEIWVNDFWRHPGQESPLMNKKGLTPRSLFFCETSCSHLPWCPLGRRPSSLWFLSPERLPSMHTPQA